METQMDFFAIVSDVGFAIAAALAAGYFVYLTLRFILNSVCENVKNMADIITRLDARVTLINNDVVKIDVVISSALGLKQDMHKLTRSDIPNRRRK